MSVSADRQRAVRLLIRVEGGAFASRLLAAESAAGIRARVLGTLRWQRLLDAVLTHYCSRPLRSLDEEVRAALRMGLFEAAKLGVPRAVATDAAVRLVRQLGKSSASGLVNAVLRRAAAGFEAVERTSSPDLATSHPRWLYERWHESFGAGAAERAMACAQEPAPTWVWFHDDSARQRVIDAEIDLLAHPWCPEAWTSPEKVTALLEDVKRGNAYAQDPSSQLVARVGASLASEDGSLVDLCAAPGGKVALLSGLRTWRCVVSLDLRPVRARLLRRLRDPVVQAGVVIGDASRPPLVARAWDLVLVDAPCTGTGTLRRHPELKWSLRPEAVAEMAAVQGPIISAATELVAPGGVLLYSTCSVEPEENEDHFAAGWRDFEAVNVAEVLPPGVPADSTAAGGCRILPCREGDGFTLHALRRVSG